MHPLQVNSNLLVRVCAAAKGRGFLWSLSLIVSLAVGAAIFLTSPFALPSENLDSSWRWALHEAFCHSLRFGKEIVFTFGPLGFLHGRMYHPETFPLLVASKFGLLLILAWSLFEVARKRDLWFLAVPPFLLLSSLISVHDDAAWAFLQFCVCIALTRSESRPFAVAAGMAMALISLAKFMFFPTSVFLVVVLLVFGSGPMRWWFAGSFLCAILGCWVAIGQELIDLPLFISKSLDISLGYTEAMATETPRPRFELRKYVIGCLVLLVASVLAVSKEEKKAGRTISIILFMIMICFVFLKLGFVRHDVHTTIAYSTLALLALGTTLSALVDSRRLAAILAFLVCTYTTVSFSRTQDVARLQASPKDGLLKVIRVVTGRTPPPWEGLHSRYEMAKEEIRARNPLPSLEGTVDVISFNQGVLFAHDMRWKPRPVFQSYSCYTPQLITLNGYALEKEGPENLLVRIQPIDGRLTTQEDSKVWQVLLGYYEAVGAASDFVLFKRRTTALGWTGQEIISGRAKTGQIVRLPETQPGSLLWLSIDIDETMGDRMRTAVFKPPETRLVTIGSHSSEKNRYLVMAGKAGFIVSPRILSIADLLALSAGQLPPSGDVTAFSLERGSGDGERSFGYHISLHRILQ